MARLGGNAVRQLDFGEATPAAGGAGRGLRLALPSGALRGPDKYKVLEHRRRQAQIKARRLLEIAEEHDASRL
jgi:hypothetical protein